jgi:hypothetical protein
MTSKRVRENRVIRGDLTKDREREAPTGREHPTHLPQGCTGVWNELQPLLTQYHLETAIRKGQGTQVALPPFYRDARGGRERPRHVEHTGVEIHAHDVREVAKPLRGNSGDNAGPTRCIQDPVTWLEYHVCKHQSGQGPAKRMHRLALIQLGSVPF